MPVAQPACMHAPSVTLNHGIHSYTRHRYKDRCITMTKLDAQVPQAGQFAARKALRLQEA